MEHTVVFDMSPGGSGAYYVTGDVVWHEGRVCLVSTTSRLDGQRFRARLQVVARPTPEQRRRAEDWRGRFGGRR